MASPTTAVQWNSQIVRSDKSDLIFLLQKYSPTVAAVSETWLRPGSHFRMPDFVCLRNDGSDGYSGVAVLIRNHTPFSPVGILTHGEGFQAVVVKVEDTTFLSLYIASPSPLILNELEAIISTLILCWDADWNGYRDQLGHRFAKLPKLESLGSLANLWSSRFDSEAEASEPTSYANTLSQVMLSVADDMFPLKKHTVVDIPPTVLHLHLLDLELSASKSNLVVFSRKRTVPDVPVILGAS
ncbi:hypothetical protein EVAR_85074_1 [Eumeta japonica]|uniref:Uncharacterized protein n=1 Tax=Eumeta variegata TaxID=151549 RepID=A0A4C1XC85_EUMVA|nr:hypothetical protein EVAR_85074_1 [Eumeta japonica]